MQPDGSIASPKSFHDEQQQSARDSLTKIAEAVVIDRSLLSVFEKYEAPYATITRLQFFTDLATVSQTTVHSAVRPDMSLFEANFLKV